MSEAMKRFKETEKKVHESLYGNLSLLSALYPTTHEFAAVFRKDMFVKNNKAGFHQVIHYLLDILDSVKTREIFPSWPLIDIRDEPKIRNDLISYINGLNIIYPSANVPKCRASTLISPAGFSFALFMLKISQLVMFEHLCRNGQAPLYPMKTNHKIASVIKCQDENLKNETARISCKTKELIDEFNNNLNKNKDMGLEITTQLEILNKEICSKKKQLENNKAEFNTKFPMYPTLLSLENEITQLKCQIDKLLTLSETLKSNEDLLKWLGSSNGSLEHSEEDFIVPENIGHIFSSRKELDLCQYFQAILVLLEKKALQLQNPCFDLETLKSTREEIQHQIRKYESILKELKQNEEIMNCGDYLE